MRKLLKPLGWLYHRTLCCRWRFPMCEGFHYWLSGHRWSSGQTWPDAGIGALWSAEGGK